jgi:transposase InsO family protein
MRKTARHFGVHPSTVMRWVRKKQLYGTGPIPTLSSRPHHHPRELSSDIVKAILDYREKYQRCAEVIHHLLTKDGYTVSLSSVKRTLKRYGCTRYSKWKKWHKYPERPKPEKPGRLVEVDTIWDGISPHRLYIYTLLDVCTRWSYARPVQRIAAGASARFVQSARKSAPFSFQTLQSDHGSEFSKWFTKKMQTIGLAHRHSRVRTPSDNGHLERFNRTIQEECLNRVPRSLYSWRKAIPDYLHYYNTKRPHMGLDMKTPLEVLRSY